MRLSRAALSLAPFLAVSACGGGDLVLPSDSDPAHIVILQGDAQTGNAGAVLGQELVVEVTDAQDRAISGLRVAFEVVDGGVGATVAPDTVATGTVGTAGATWTLGGTLGSQTVDAIVVGEELSVRFTATAVASGANRLVAISGDGQTAPVGTALADSLVVRVEDNFGNPVSGIEVGWTASDGEVSPNSVVTGDDGRAAARRILGTVAGQHTTTATAAGLAGSPVTFTHTAVPGSAASLVLISGTGQTAPPGSELPEPLVVRVVDEAGNGIPSQAVTWIVASGGGSVSPGTSQTNGDGVASARWTLGSSGSNALNAVASGVGIVGFTATAGGGGSGPSASRSAVEANPTSIQALTGSSTIRVTVRDGSGDPIPGATVRLAVTGSGNTLTQPASTTGADGVATGTLSSTVPGTKVVSAVVNGSVALNETAEVSVSLAAATAIELLEGDGQSAEAGAAVPVRPAVRVINSLGQPVAGFSVTFVVTGGGGDVTGATQTTNSDGVARAGNWTLGPDAGANSLEARAGSLQGSPVVFTATATAASELRFEFTVQPSDVDEDQPFSVQVSLRDAGGTLVPLTGIRLVIAIFRDGDDRPSNNRLRGDREQETVNGVAVFGDLEVTNGDEGYRLRVRSDDLPLVEPAFSVPFDVD